MLPRNAAQQGFAETYTAGDEYSRGPKEVLVQAIRDVRSDVVGAGRVIELGETVQSALESDSDVLSILWQHGLLGYRDRDSIDGHSDFYSLGGVDRFHLPLGREQYVFHPCLIDRTGLTPASSIPVLPWSARA